jgi:hypothetical protein
VDANGREINSLVIERVDREDQPAPTIKYKSWPSTLKVFHAALIEATLDFGFDYRIPAGPTVRAVDLDHASDAFCKTYVVKGRPDSTPEQIKESRALAFSRALDRAQKLDLIAARVEGTRQIVWTVSPFESA